MSPTANTLVERLAFDGPIHVAAVVAIGIALAGLFAWSLRRECDVIGAKNAVLFWALRVSALGVAMWMLLAPSTIRFQRSTTRQSIAVAVDISRSMQTVDPPDSADDLRWALAADDAGRDRSALAAADRALAAAAIAEHRLHEAAASLKNEAPERTSLEAAAAAHQAVERTKINLQGAIERLARPQSDGASGAAALSDQASSVLQTLEGAEFRTLAELSAAVHTGRDSLKPAWRESLADLERQAASIRRRIAELTKQIGEQEKAAPSQFANQLAEIRKASRLARTTRFVDSVDANLLRPLAGEVDVRYASFDWALFPVGAQDAPAAAIARQTNGRRSKVDRESPAATDDDSPVTDLTATLDQIHRTKREQPLAAVFLFTDAAHNRPGARDPSQAAAEFEGTPVYVVPIGADERLRDVELKNVSAPSVAMKDDEVVVEAAIEAHRCEGELLRVELLRDGAVIQNRDVQLESSPAVQRVRFNAPLPEIGLARLQVRIAPLEGEQSEENNFEQFEIQVTRNHIDVLLADELPRWEYRYLVQLFRRDEKIACDELLFRPRRIATGRRAESKEFPATADDWAEYDVVLLGDVSTERLSIASQESLAEFVRERGGTLVMIAGDEFMPQAYVNQPLEELLPVTKADESDRAGSIDGFAFHVTEEGWRHHALLIADTEESTRIAWDFINRNSPVHSVSSYRRPRPTARTLISAVSRASLDVEQDAAQSALLCWQPVGRGRVVYLASPETYRLRFLHGDRLHYRFWGQLLRWAIADELALGSQWASIRTDRSEYRSGQSVQVAVQLKDEAGKPAPGAAVDVAATGAGGSQTTVSLEPDESVPGRYIGVIEGLASGVYRLEPKGADVERLQESADGETRGLPVASFTVRSPVNRELLDTRCNRALARQIAEASGGQVLPPTAVGEVLALTDLEPIVTEKTETLPLWVEWKYLWIVFGCLFAEWRLRKRMGLS